MRRNSADLGEGIAAIILRWLQLRASIEGLVTPLPVISDGLPLRAQRVLDHLSARTVQGLLEADPYDLLERDNVGRTTLAALVSRAEECIPPITVDITKRDFVQVADRMLGNVSERAHRIIVARFEENKKGSDVARTEAITRQRVSQIEATFLSRLTAAVRKDDLLPEDIMSDGVVEFEELSAGYYRAKRIKQFYISLARTILTNGDSRVDSDRFYSSQLQLLAGEIQNSDDFILARMPLTRVMELAAHVTPALLELPPDELLRRTLADLRAKQVGSFLVGPRPTIKRVIRALLRSADGPMNISVLTSRLAMSLAAYGEISFFDEIRTRTRISTMEDVTLLDEQTAVLGDIDPPAARQWVDLVVAEIQRAGKPYSLVRFINEHDDAPFGAFALASLLRCDSRVIHVGRRLYAPAEYTADGPLGVVDLIEDALRTGGRPMTRRELLSQIREKRDFVTSQLDRYFASVPGIAFYTSDIVGCVPLTRSVMLQMLAQESCVESLLRRARNNTPVSASALWLLDDEEPDMTSAEEDSILRAGSEWQLVEASTSIGGLFFRLKESR